MSTELVALLAFAPAFVAAALAVYVVLGEESAPVAWAASTLGASGLVLALAGGTTNALDLATVAGVALVATLAGAGWQPSGRRTLLGLGLLGLLVGAVARLAAFSYVAVPELGPEAALAEAASRGPLLGVARSAGFVAFASAGASIVLGARRPAKLPIEGLPARLFALHRALGMVAVLATAAHLLALGASAAVELSWVQILILPWSTPYNPTAAILGWLATLCLLATAASGFLKRRLPNWRVVHYASYATFVLGLLHGLIAGTHTGSPRRSCSTSRRWPPWSGRRTGGSSRRMLLPGASRRGPRRSPRRPYPIPRAGKDAILLDSVFVGEAARRADADVARSHDSRPDCPLS